MAERLSKRSVEAIAPAERDVVVFDSEVAGFGVKVTPKGTRVYLLQYAIGGRGAAKRRVRLGEHGSEITAEQARKEAIRLRGEIAAGRDPVAERAKRPEITTVAELAERYMREHALPHKKPLSIEADRRNLDNHVLPLLGRRALAEVSRPDISAALQAIQAGKTSRDEKTGKQGRRIVKGGRGAANRSLALLSKMFNLAEVWGLRPDGSNPCRQVQKFAESKAHRFLSGDELARLGKALADSAAGDTENPAAVSAIRLLLLTGSRVGEVLALRWNEVDLERALLNLPDSKTGAKSVLLPAAAVDVLRALQRPQDAQGPVFRGKRPGQRLESLRGPWERIRKAAGLEGVRLHDLRHTFASAGAAGGLSLQLIGNLLGHTQARTTERYAHLVDDARRQAAEMVGARLAGALGRES